MLNGATADHFIYLKIAGTFSFLYSVPDRAKRYILHCEFRCQMSERDLKRIW